MINKISRKTNVKDLCLFGLLLASVVFWFNGVIFYRNIFAYADLGRYFYPIRQFAAESIRSGHIPLWNPYLKSGAPFLAILQSCIFYPVSLITYLSPSFDCAFNWYIITHFILAGIFMYLLMRHWRASRIASSISSIVFVFGGYLSSVINMNTSLSSVIWLPLIVLFFDKAMKRRQFIFALITGIFLAIQFLGGEPTIIYCVIWFLFLYFLFFSFRLYKDEKDYKGVIKLFFIFAVAVLSWIFISMIQFLPFAELLINSTRAHPRGFEFASRWSLMPSEIFSFFIPFIYGNITEPAGHFTIQDWMTSFYVGILPLLFAAFALLVKPGKKTLFLAGIFTLSLILALGKYTPIYGFLYKYVFGFAYIRYPVKFIFLSVFTLAALSGIGYDTLVNTCGENKRRNFARRLILFNGLSAIALIFFLRFWKDIYGYVIKGSLFGKIDMVPDFRILSVVYLSDSANICRLFIILTVSILAIVFFYKKKIRLRVLGFLAVAIIFFDLSSVNMGISKIAGRDIFRLKPESYSEILKDDSMFRILRTTDIVEINKAVWGFDYPVGQYERKITFDGNRAMVYRFFDAQGYGSIFRRDRMDFMNLIGEVDEPLKSRLVSLLNIKYIISTEPIKGEQYEVVYRGSVARFPLINNGKKYFYFYINKNNAFLDRAFLVNEAKVAKDRGEALELLKDRKFDPSDTVILEEEGQPLSQGPRNNSTERADIISYEPEEVVIKAIVEDPKYLVFGDSYYPGWKVFVDGKPSALYRANIFLRAVYLDKGEHTVRFLFDPVTYKIGKLISIASISFLALFFIFQIKRSHNHI